MTLPTLPSGPGSRRLVHPVVERLAAYAWRLLVIAAAGGAVLWLIGQIWVVGASLVIALMLARVLNRPASRLRSHGWPPVLAATTVLLVFLPLVVAALTFVGMSVAGEADELGPTVSQAVDDIEKWLIEDSPFNINAADIEELRRNAGQAVGDTLRSSGGKVVSGAILVVEVLLSVLLGLILTFFLLKDGDRFLAWIQRQVPSARRPLAGRLAERAWRTLGGYLRGAAVLGFLEGTIIGITLVIVGAELAPAVGMVTFLLAFVPFVGAIVAGVLAALVALATAGTAAALIVVIVAVVVQQLDNDLLAPMIYGKALEIHPVVILLGITAGGALFGLAGSFLAVPVTAVVTNVLAEARLAAGESKAPEDRGDPAERPVAT